MKKKAEPLRRESVEHFLRLLEAHIGSERELSYPLPAQQIAAAPAIRLSDLMSVTPKAERNKRRTEKAWAEINAHSLYQWLEKQPTFCASWKLFLRCRARPTPQQKKIVAVDAPFIFLHIFVEWAAILREVKKLTLKGKFKRGPTSSGRKRAVKYARNLIQLSDEGIGLSGVERLHLKRLLNQFIREVESIKRKRRDDKNSSLRHGLEHVAWLFLQRLELTYPSILANLAALANVECPIKNAQRYFAAARRKHQEDLTISALDT